MMWHILKNGWEDKEFIRPARLRFRRCPRKEVEKWNPQESRARHRRVPGAQLERVAKMFATEKPSTLIWCHGPDPEDCRHRQRTGQLASLLLMTGNVGGQASGANIFRGHDNVQGATDVGLDIVTLPFYYGLAEGAWKHWSRVWEVDYDYLASRASMRSRSDGDPGIPLTRWFEAVTAAEGPDRARRTTCKAVFVQGHACNSITRIPESLNGLKALELLVIADPHPTTRASLVGRGRPQGRRLHSAGCHAVRVQGLAGRLEPLAAMGRADREADLRVEGRSRDHLSHGEEVRFRRPRCSRTSRSRTIFLKPRTCCARSTAAAGRPAIAGSRRSASRRT